MNVSFNWLKRYLDCDLSAERMAEILTELGLEVEEFEKIETIKGGLKGVETLEEVIAEDGQSATVKVKMIYGDGSEEIQDVDMVLNDKGEWKASMSK